MEKVILYSTGCPKCNVLKKKLSDIGVEFTIVDDVDYMKGIGLSEAPMLDVDGTMMDFKAAVDWVRSRCK